MYPPLPMKQSPANTAGTNRASIEGATGPYQLEAFSSQDNVGYLLKRAWLALASSVDQKLAPYGLTYQQFVILVRLNEGSCSTAVELAREVGTDTGAMTRMLDRLESKDTLRRVRSSQDRRAINLEITDAGREMANRAMGTAISVLNHYLGDFSVDEVKLLEGLLVRMISRGDSSSANQPTR